MDQAVDSLHYKEKINIQYKSYQLQPHAEIDQTKTLREALAETYHIASDEAEQWVEDIRFQAAEVGLHCFGMVKTTNSFDAHRVVKAAAKEGKEKEMVERLLQAYFIETKQISDHDTLLQLASDVGLDTKKIIKVLESRKFSSFVRDDVDEAHEIGIQNVPFYVFNETYAVTGVQPMDILIEVIEQIWEEECQNPNSEAATIEPSETCYCSDDECKL